MAEPKQSGEVPGNSSVAAVVASAAYTVQTLDYSSSTAAGTNLPDEPLAQVR